jgi:hypothetical protein
MSRLNIFNIAADRIFGCVNMDFFAQFMPNIFRRIQLRAVRRQWPWRAITLYIVLASTVFSTFSSYAVLARDFAQLSG